MAVPPPPQERNCVRPAPRQRSLRRSPRLTSRGRVTRRIVPSIPHLAGQVLRLPVQMDMTRVSWAWIQMPPLWDTGEAVLRSVNPGSLHRRLRHKVPMGDHCQRRRDRRGRRRSYSTKTAEKLCKSLVTHRHELRLTCSVTSLRDMTNCERVIPKMPRLLSRRPAYISRTSLCIHVVLYTYAYICNTLCHLLCPSRIPRGSEPDRRGRLWNVEMVFLSACLFLLVVSCAR